MKALRVAVLVLLATACTTLAQQTDDQNQPRVVTTTENIVAVNKSGDVEIPKGTTLKLIGIWKGGLLDVRYHGQEYPIFANQTDFEKRVTTLAQQTNEVDVAALTKNRSEWPAEVALTEKMPFPIIIDGKEVGSAEYPAGMKLKLIEVQGEEVKVAHSGAVKVIPSKSTDLIARVVQARTLKMRQVAAREQTAITDSRSDDATRTPQPHIAVGALQRATGRVVLPCRYVTYRVYSLTGVLDEGSVRPQTAQVVLEIRRHEDFIKFTARAKGITDSSSDEETLLSYDMKSELLTALQSIGKRRLDQKMTPTDKEESLFSSGQVKLRCIYTADDKQVSPELTIGTREFRLLSDSDVGALMREINRL
jgi:hypothetical protein